MKTYKITDDYTGEQMDVMLEVEEYEGNGRVALQLYCDEGPYATLSVNLPKEKCGGDEFFVDVNNCPWAPAFLERNGIAESAYYIAFSGFCAYPKYRLTQISY